MCIYLIIWCYHSDEGWYRYEQKHGHQEDTPTHRPQTLRAKTTTTIIQDIPTTNNTVHYNSTSHQPTTQDCDITLLQNYRTWGKFDEGIFGAPYYW